jgi:hypothetical protein
MWQRMESSKKKGRNLNTIWTIKPTNTSAPVQKMVAGLQI